MSSQRSQPRLIPVLDVMHGQVVHAVGGRRHEYRPIVSKLTSSTEPVEVAKALLEATGASELYVADLDAIRERNGPSPEVRELLHSVPLPVWLDCGLTGLEEASELRWSRWLQPVYGLETADAPAIVSFGATEALLTAAFSLDLRGGELMGRWAVWGARDAQDALGVARTAVRCALHTLIVLDLARVGTGAGCGTEQLLRAIRNEFPGVDLIAGGGVKTWADIDRLGEAGADAVFVASALHDRTLAIPRPPQG
jgi:phosphoribosylformimino-5-aminoimidazole carboxamide ribotide isomerase